MSLNVSTRALLVLVVAAMTFGTGAGDKTKAAEHQADSTVGQGFTLPGSPSPLAPYRRAAAGVDKEQLWATDPSLWEAIHDLEPAARTKWPYAFTGIWPGPEGWLSGVHIAFTSAAENKVALLAESFPRPELLVSHNVANSYARLERTQQQMQDALHELSNGSQQDNIFADSFIDIMHNRLALLAESNPRELSDSLNAAFDVPIVVTRGRAGDTADCVSRNNCAPYLRSGIGDAYYDPEHEKYGGCSLAFSITHSGVSGILSAAHCGSPHDDNYTRKHNDVVFGHVRNQQMGGRVDVERLSVEGEYKAAPRIYVTNDEKARAVKSESDWSSVKPWTDIQIGDPVRKSGRATSFTQGNVLIKNGSNGGLQLPNTERWLWTTMCVRHGDSGAGVFHGTEAIGIVSASHDLDTIDEDDCANWETGDKDDYGDYSFIGHIQFALNHMHSNLRFEDYTVEYGSCITGEAESGDYGSGACTSVPDESSSGSYSGLDDLQGVVVSSDGQFAYAGAAGDDAIATFGRDPGSGDLSFVGCVSADAYVNYTYGVCDEIAGGPSYADGTDSGLDGVSVVALSPDGERLYAASSVDDAISVFDRDTETGELTFGSCVTGDSDGWCSPLASATSGGANSGLDDIQGIAVSSDGEDVYVVSASDDAVAKFDDDLTFVDCTTGETQSGGAGSGACTATSTATYGGANSGLDGVKAVVVSSDDNLVAAMASGDDSVATFTVAGTAFDSCISGNTSAGPTGSGACLMAEHASSGGAASGFDGLSAIAVDNEASSVVTIFLAASQDDAVQTLIR